MANLGVKLSPSGDRDDMAMMNSRYMGVLMGKSLIFPCHVGLTEGTHGSIFLVDQPMAMQLLLLTQHFSKNGIPPQDRVP